MKGTTALPCICFISICFYTSHRVTVVRWVAGSVATTMNNTELYHVRLQVFCYVKHRRLLRMYALLIFKHSSFVITPQPRRRARDSRGKVLCFYFSNVSAVPRKYQGFVSYRQIWQCNENITDCRGKSRGFTNWVSPQ